MSARAIGALGLVLAGCAAAASAPPARPAPPRPSAGTPLSATPVAVPGAAAKPPVPGPVAPEPLPLEVTQVLTVPVSAIGIGEGTRVAALSETPYVGDARGLHALPLPPALRGKPSDVDQAGIFFGRDNEPRVMGTRRSGSAEMPIYWRHLPNGWRDGREEIGQLGGPVPSGLWGVLGSADPELVCRVGAQCIIKRTSGWTSAPAGSVVRSVTLQERVLWGLDPSGIAGIDAHGWALAIPAPNPAWPTPRAFWATRGEAWVSAEERLFHYSEGTWRVVTSPVGEAWSFWGARAGSIWVAGSRGAAHFDGHEFRLLKVSGPLRVVQGRSDAEVWLGGDAGLFRVGPAREGPP